MPSRSNRLEKKKRLGVGVSPKRHSIGKVFVEL